MKRLAPYALLLLIILFATNVYSQNPGLKPKQFANYPSVISCSEAELSKAFNSSPGQAISLSFSDNFSFSGNVTSNISKYNNLQSAVLNSPVFNNTIFSISKLTNADHSITYVGRIINRNYFDGYELKKDITGNYKLLKIETDKVIQDCSQN